MIIKAILGICSRYEKNIVFEYKNTKVLQHLQVFLVPLPSGAGVQAGGRGAVPSTDPVHQVQPDLGGQGSSLGPRAPVVPASQLCRVPHC